MTDADIVEELWTNSAKYLATAGQALREHRERLGWNQHNLAEACGINQPDLCRIENGHLCPNPYQLDRIMLLLRGHRVPVRAVEIVPRTRTTDPRSSHYGVAKLAADETTRHLVHRAILAHDHDEFTDTDLFGLIKSWGHDKPRGSVAKFRGWAEERGEIERTGCRPDHAGRTLLHFRNVS